MGKICLIGGNLDLVTSENERVIRRAGLRSIHSEILLRILSEMNGIRSRIEIITAASEIPLATGKEYKKALELLGCGNVRIMNFKKPIQADQHDNLERLRRCDGIIFTGGDQTLICEALLGSRFLDILKKRYSEEKDVLIVGTSAGAMALTKVMIARGMPSEALRKGRVKLSEGLGLLSKVIVDTHFIKRGRFGRLIEAVARYPDMLGIGLGENTAVYFERREKVETIGSNLVVLIDGSRLKYNNFKYIQKEQPICLEDIRLHILPKHHRFNIAKRKIYNRRKKEEMIGKIEKST